MSFDSALLMYTRNIQHFVRTYELAKHERNGNDTFVLTMKNEHQHNNLYAVLPHQLKPNMEERLKTESLL